MTAARVTCPPLGNCLHLDHLQHQIWQELLPFLLQMTLVDSLLILSYALLLW